MAQPRVLTSSDPNKAIRDELILQLNGGHAHAPLESVLKGIPREKCGEVPKGLPYSLWQLLEHLRIAQEDILRFSTSDDGGYRELAWPDEYWPKKAAPPAEDAWDTSVAQLNQDRHAMCEAIADPARDLFKPFPWGDGQNLLREAMVLIDHNAYHMGEMIAVRRLLGIWPPKK
jgi:hypothetical protein